MSREVVALRFGVLVLVLLVLLVLLAGPTVFPCPAVVAGAVTLLDDGVGLCWCWCALSADGVRRPVGALLCPTVLVLVLLSILTAGVVVGGGGVRTGEDLSSACCSKTKVNKSVSYIEKHTCCGCCWWVNEITNAWEGYCSKHGSSTRYTTILR